MEHAVKSEFVAILIFLNKAPSAAADGLECFKRSVEAARPNPLCKKLRIGMRLENKLARRIKFACDKEFLFARFCGDRGFILRHGFLLLFDPCGNRIVSAPTRIHPASGEGISILTKRSLIVGGRSFFTAPDREGVAFHFIDIIKGHAVEETIEA